MDYFYKIKDYLHQLGIEPVEENVEEGYFVITEVSRHLNNLYLSIKSADLLVDQFIYEVPSENLNYQAILFKSLLQMSGELTHGAFVLDSTGRSVLFHDTLALENLDLNELEASINAITLGFEEFGGDLLTLHKEGS